MSYSQNQSHPFSNTSTHPFSSTLPSVPATMQNMVRGESRPRRPSSTDTMPRANRSRRSPSSHRIDFATPTLDHTPHTSHPSPIPLYPAIKPFAFFSVTPLLYHHPYSNVFIIAFPAFFFAFLSLAILTRCFFSPKPSFLPTSSNLSSIPSISFLYLYEILATFIAIKLIGPIHALFAVFAQPVLVHCAKGIAIGTGTVRRVSLVCALFAIVAVAFLAYDGTGRHAPGRRAAKVRDRVMQSAAGRAVNDRIRNLSNKVKDQYLPESSLSKTFSAWKLSYKRFDDNLVEKPISDDDTENDKIDQNAQDEQEGNIEQVQGKIESPDDGENEQIRNISKSNAIQEENEEQAENQTKNENGRKLQSIVKGEAILGLGNSTMDVVERQANEDTIMKEDEADDANNDNEDDNRTPLINVILGIILAMTASFARRIAEIKRVKLAGDNVDSIIPYSLIFLFCSIALLPLLALIFLVDHLHGHDQLSEVTTKFILSCCGISFLFLVIPACSQHNHRIHLDTQPNSPTFSRTINRNRQQVPWSMLSLNSEHEAFSVFQSFGYFFIVAQLVSLIGLRPDSSNEKVTFSCFLTATILTSISLMITPTQAKYRRSSSTFSWSRARNADRAALSTELRGNFLINLKGLILDIKNFTTSTYVMALDLTSHARSNKASWQVLNFLVLQFGMAIIELIYATAADSASLFSVSADNFFCGIALGIGLFSIRVSSRKPSQTYPYGLARVESISGFSNGIILIYIAVLVVLESYERACSEEDIAAGQAFSVCILGTIGNVLGLFFFPPESRRENHNVQGIYLHIWANTLAFASMAITTVIKTAQPQWKSIDMIVSVIVAMCVIAMAIPLLVRSARLLLLLQPKSTTFIVGSAYEQFSQIHGVASVSALRVWNLTPNSLVGSVRLTMSHETEASDTEILLHARSIFASIGIPASQCTIHVSRVWQ